MINNFVTKMQLGILPFSKGRATLYENGEYDFEVTSQKKLIQVRKRLINSNVGYSRIGLKVRNKFGVLNSTETNYISKTEEPSLKTILIEK